MTDVETSNAEREEGFIKLLGTLRVYSKAPLAGQIIYQSPRDIRPIRAPYKTIYKIKHHSDILLHPKTPSKDHRRDL